MTKRVILYSGQGAQFVGMGADLVDAYPVCAEMARTANDVLGFDIADVCFNGPEEKLTQSDHAQPAIFLVSAMCHAGLKEKFPEKAVDFLAGLSLGEWTALYAAGVLSFENALKALQTRGRFMQEACENSDGGMITLLGLNLEQATEVAKRTGLEVANLNSPIQTVLSGATTRLPEAEAVAKEMGAKRAVILNVAGAFHSSMMQSAADKLADYLTGVEFRVPAIPVVSNVTAHPHQNDVDKIKDTMVKQVTSSVRWVESIEWLKAQGATQYVECGPGKVLTGLVKRIDKTASLGNVQSSVDLQKL